MTRTMTMERECSCCKKTFTPQTKRGETSIDNECPKCKGKNNPYKKRGKNERKKQERK